MSTTGCCMGLSAKDCLAFGKCGSKEEYERITTPVPKKKKKQKKRQAKVIGYHAFFGNLYDGKGMDR